MLKSQRFVATTQGKGQGKAKSASTSNGPTEELKKPKDGIVARGDKVPARGDIVSAVADGINQGADAISKDVGNITEVVTGVATGILTPETLTQDDIVTALTDGLDKGAALISTDVANVTDVVTEVVRGLFTPNGEDGQGKIPTQDEIVSGLAEGLNNGAGLISKDVRRITEIATEVLSTVFGSETLGNIPVNNIRGVAGGSGLLAGGSGIGPLQGPISSFDIPTSPPEIDDHMHTGWPIADVVAPAAQYAPVSLKRPEEGSIAEYARDTLQTLVAKLEDRDRLLRFYSPLQGDKRLYLSSMQGSAVLSELGSYTLQLVSINASIDLQELLGKSVTAAVCLADGQEHPLNGYVTSFGFVRSDGGLAIYDAEITPWLWYLTKRVNSRIYQDVTVLDVVERVFRDYGALVDYEVRVAQTPPVDNYVVQYNETDFNFISRLLEKYGLFYYFEHRHDGHTLVICDDSFSEICCPPQRVHPIVPFNDGERIDRQDSVTHLSTQRTVQIGTVALNTYDYKKPSNIPYLEQPTVAVQGDIPVLEVYDGNPAFMFRSSDEGNQEAKRRLETHEWQAKLFFAQSECRGMTVGRTFQLQRHFWFDAADSDDAEFLVIGMQIEATNTLLQVERSGGSYRNNMTMIRRKIPYRPIRTHVKPAMRGPQMATVVGPKGQEIYTDSLGRIKVQFPWDRHGRFDDASSCWIRVSQPWAGRGWGTIAIPRIGQEVIIDFFEGDPDRPVCIGRLFNAEQAAPYALPDGAHIMGSKSRSTPGGGGFCEMVIHDLKGKELINIHSQKDLCITVRDTETHLVKKGNRSVTLEHGDEMKTLMKGSLVETIDHTRSTKAGTVSVNATKGHGDDAGKQLYFADKVIRHQVGQGSIEMTTENIVITFGPSKIVLCAEGIDVEGPVIHLNKDK